MTLSQSFPWITHPVKAIITGDNYELKGKFYSGHDQGRHCYIAQFKGCKSHRDYNVKFVISMLMGRIDYLKNRRGEQGGALTIRNLTIKQDTISFDFYENGDWYIKADLNQILS